MEDDADSHAIFGKSKSATKATPAKLTVTAPTKGGKTAASSTDDDTKASKTSTGTSSGASSGASSGSSGKKTAASSSDDDSKTSAAATGKSGTAGKGGKASSSDDDSSSQKKKKPVKTSTTDDSTDDTSSAVLTADDSTDDTTTTTNTTTTTTTTTNATSTDDYNPKYSVAGDDDQTIPAAPTDDKGSDDAGEHPVGKRHKKNQENRDTGDDDIANPMEDDADSHAIFGKSKSTTKTAPEPAYGASPAKLRASA